MLSEGKFYETTTYNMHVMEGVAAGDAFGAGLYHGLVSMIFDEAKMIQFALAASVLKLTITGDLNLVSEAEINQVAQNGNGARLSR